MYKKTKVTGNKACNEKIRALVWRQGRSGWGGPVAQNPPRSFFFSLSRREGENPRNSSVHNMGKSHRIPSWNMFAWMCFKQKWGRSFCRVNRVSEESFTVFCFILGGGGVGYVFFWFDFLCFLLFIMMIVVIFEQLLTCKDELNVVVRVQCELGGFRLMREKNRSVFRVTAAQCRVHVDSVTQLSAMRCKNWLWNFVMNLKQSHLLASRPRCLAEGWEGRQQGPYSTTMATSVCQCYFITVICFRTFLAERPKYLTAQPLQHLAVQRWLLILPKTILDWPFVTARPLNEVAPECVLRSTQEVGGKRSSRLRLTPPPPTHTRCVSSKQHRMPQKWLSPPLFAQCCCWKQSFPFVALRHADVT